MTTRSDSEHYIALRKRCMRDRLCSDPSLPPEQRDRFQQLCRLLEATIHFEFHARLEAIKDAYAPFDPDDETSREKLDASETNHRLDSLFQKFVTLLERANFTRLSHDDIRGALTSASDWGLNLNVDFDAFDRMELFARGDSIGRRSRRNWRQWFRLEEVDVAVFRRLVLILRLRDRQPLHDRLDTHSVFIKIFKDIPKVDLEMLLPGTSVRMTMTDRGKIVLPVLSGIAITIWKIIKGAIVLAAAGIYGTLAVLGLVGGTIGYGVRSFFGYLQTKQKYQLSLTQSLYYQNLDNNCGAICRLIDGAEEQECCESLLAYFFLWNRGGAAGWTARQLDEAVESYLNAIPGARVDFEIEDALQKLRRFGIIDESADGRIRAVPIDAAMQRLDHAWDNYFRYDAPHGDGEASPLNGPHHSNETSSQPWSGDRRSESYSPKSA
jgi:hypothetical protein